MKTQNNLLLVICLVLANFTYSQTNTFPTSGNVGIGTSGPTAKTDMYLPQFATMESGLRITSPFAFQQGSTINSLFHIRKNGLRRGSFGTQFIVRTNGKVGIGEENPNSKLHVHNGRIQITGNNSYGGPMMIFGGDTNAPSGNWGIEYVSGGVAGLNFWKPSGSSNFGNYKMFLTDTGKVSIGLDPNTAGTFNGNFKLYVADGIMTEKVKVTLRSSSDWADYVFEDNYELLPLEEVEAHIEKNGHLPNVPSAEEVAKEGINLAKMDAKLLEKIEELTLYVIEQQKQIKKLQEQLKTK
ncbi:hypothetical protein [uncultured Kordia sp.]|uniref:hypothetical protein n=1 Tax=uncultured Kordia sp. TaxID=507699 RepID=UPI0026121289|nr:hypothetical protein [uncultured Kordia sp.]